MQQSSSSQQTYFEAFLQRLRSETSALHNQLDSSPAANTLMSNTASVNDYIQYLKGFEPIVRFYEQQVFPMVADIFPDIEQRRKLNFLLADLHQLNESERSPKVFHLQLASTCRAVGYMYVMEGSTLGGAVIKKHLSKTGIATEQTSTYLGAYKEHTGQRWKQFLEHLSEYVYSAQCDDEIIDGAKDAFQQIHDHLNG